MTFGLRSKEINRNLSKQRFPYRIISRRTFPLPIAPNSREKIAWPRTLASAKEGRIEAGIEQRSSRKNPKRLPGSRESPKQKPYLA
ncbi:hypothetical protein GW17_00048365 [Ensete ventricosum]|nr:hypothetical protein GW17_00048365 [Ensete ventricosum]RZS04015.1 hypothetical protein BHM03_00034273 [Ensete ventricosum]